MSLGFDPHFNLLDVYFYEDVHKPELQAQLLDLANTTAEELDTLLRVDSGDTSFEHIIQKVVKPAVYDFYKNETFCKKGEQ